MKNISAIVKSAQKLLDDNSPVILTGVAVAGTFATAWFTFKGTQKATIAISDEADKRNHQAEGLGVEPTEITNQEKFLATWKFYAPAAVAVIGTTTCMVLATKISLNRTAALAGALVLAERGSDQYKDKVKELLGEKKHIQVTDAVAEEKLSKIPAGYLPEPREGEQIFVDARSMRPISMTKDKIEKAVNALNAEMLEYTYASLSDFYEKVGLEPTQDSDSIGWNNQRLLKLNYTAILKDDRAVQLFTFDRSPMPDFRDGQI
jgi:hypothetical protein